MKVRKIEPNPEYRKYADYLDENMCDICNYVNFRYEEEKDRIRRTKK